MYESLHGIWAVKLNNGITGEMILPGTLDTNHLGCPKPESETPAATRFTRKYSYEGTVVLTRRITYLPPEGKRVFLEAERTRCLRLKIDGEEISVLFPSTLSTPSVFEVTGRLNGNNEVMLLSDNSYPGLPHDAIVYSSAATDETQTNWNGILGYFRLRLEEPVFLSAVRVYPKQRTLDLQVEISSNQPYVGILSVESEALETPASLPVNIPAGTSSLLLNALPLAKNVHLWDEREGNLYTLTASLNQQERKTVTFGIREFKDNGNGHFSLNGRTIFLRGDTNCGIFPETGYPPMPIEEWLSILKTYQSYGVNCVRFHSYCPPEAAFTAADQIGMLLQPELSHWNPKDAFETEESFQYYQTELEQILLTLANHPSFVMLTLGNELQAGEMGHARMSQLLKRAHTLDKTRLYANGSNVHYGTSGCDRDSDFYTAQAYRKDALRGIFAGMKGHLNHQYPKSKTNYDSTMRKLRKEYQKPVFSFEVGQFEILPDFAELEEFHGISEPGNLQLIKTRAEASGFLENWKQYVEASGELALLGYREEIEAALRTRDLSGISLLSLQDFPGQGTALVGMMNSHMRPKPYSFANPERFHSIFRDQLPLVLLDKYTYEAGELLHAEICVANYGKTDISGCCSYELTGSEITLHGELSEVNCPMGTLTTVGSQASHGKPTGLEIELMGIKKASRLDLTIQIGTIKNSYPIWVYPHVTPVCPNMIYETKKFDSRTKEVLDAGGIVYLTPPSTKEHLPQSIQAQFTTDFWSVGTFSEQEGGMGQLIDSSHPIFREFPTEVHTNWQWWPMASQRAAILPKPWKTIITVMDSCAYLRPMAQLFEGRCGNGKLLFSTMGLQNLQQYPEARALLNSIYRYLSSDEFMPEQEVSPDAIAFLVNQAACSSINQCNGSL